MFRKLKEKFRENKLKRSRERYLFELDFDANQTIKEVIEENILILRLPEIYNITTTAEFARIRSSEKLGQFTCIIVDWSQTKGCASLGLDMHILQDEFIKRGGKLVISCCIDPEIQKIFNMWIIHSDYQILDIQNFDSLQEAKEFVKKEI